tara:strand:- start:819 stop:1298 length:480 start_codon:yes stop_codon:yes gene_type:complete
LSAKDKSTSFRSWFYFRTGWSVYFAFIFAAINTLVVTYYLAIENYPVLQQIFPSFGHYVLITVAIGIPVLIAAGYFHFKRSAGFKSEADVAIETNPHAKRNLLNTEAIVTSYLYSNELMMKVLKNEKISDEEMKKFLELQEKIKEHLKHKTISDSSFDI